MAIENLDSLLSNCCGAVIKFTDICSECGEHCDTIENDGSDDNNN